MTKYILLFIVFGFDIIFKQIALNFNQVIFLIPQTLAFKLFKNSALAFNILFPPKLIIVLSILIIIGLIVWASKHRSYLFPVTILLSGALSNLWDRIYYGFVIDYFYLWPMSYFNIADALILIGAVWLIFKLSSVQSKFF